MRPRQLAAPAAGTQLACRCPDAAPWLVCRARSVGNDVCVNLEPKVQELVGGSSSLSIGGGSGGWAGSQGFRE